MNHLKKYHLSEELLLVQNKNSTELPSYFIYIAQLRKDSENNYEESNESDAQDMLKIVTKIKYFEAIVYLLCPSYHGP